MDSLIIPDYTDSHVRQVAQRKTSLPSFNLDLQRLGLKMLEQGSKTLAILCNDGVSSCPVHMPLMLIAFQTFLQVLEIIGSTCLSLLIELHPDKFQRRKKRNSPSLIFHGKIRQKLFLFLIRTHIHYPEIFSQRCQRIDIS